MKKYQILLLIFLLSTSTIVFAVEVIAGAKLWFNNMKHKVSRVGNGKSVNNSLMVGPNVMVRKGKLFSTASYLFSLNDYEFTNSSSTSNISGTDFNLIGGYIIHPNISLYAGYKHLMTTEEERTQEFSFFSENSKTIDGTVKGFSLGIKGNKALNEKAALFAGFELMKMKADYPGWEKNLDGTSIELGISMPLKSNMALSVNYKHQDMDSIIFSGFGANINVAF